MLLGPLFNTLSQIFSVLSLDNLSHNIHNYPLKNLQIQVNSKTFPQPPSMNSPVYNKPIKISKP